MNQMNRMKAILLSLCLVLSLGGCRSLAGDGSGKENPSQERDISADESLAVREETSSGTEESSGANPEDGLVKSLAATVQIFADSFCGSGVIYGQWEDSLILVTAAHVIPSQCREIKVVFGDGGEAVCTDYLLAEDADCAFLRLKEDILPGDWQEKYGIVQKDRERFDAMKNEDGVFLADYQADNDLGCRFAMIIESWIYVEDFGVHMMLLSGEAHAGMSGCGVFEEDGCFLGILCGGNEEGELAVLPYSIIETNFMEFYQESR